MIDAFPHTRRPLPWVLAVFVGFLFLVPIDATFVRINLPVDSQIDRFAIVILLGIWMFLGGDQRTVWRSSRGKLFVSMVAIFWAMLLASDLLGSARIMRLDEWTLMEKQIALISSFFIVGWFTLSALRPQDLHGFSTYLIFLATVLAIGVIIESRTGYNVFYSVFRLVLRPIATVGTAPTQLNGAFTDDGRPIVVGSTEHGLAAVTVLACVMGFALMRTLDATTRRSWWLNATAFALMASAAVATQKKTSIIALLAVVLFVGLHRPRQFLRILPLGVLLLGAVHNLAPGSLGTILDPAMWFKSSSSAHRSSDFGSLFPDISAHPLFGRGYGSTDPDLVQQFRILDDQLLGILWQMGIFGLLSYVGMILAPIVDARWARRSANPALARVAIPASAGCLAYLVVNGLFDALAFSEAPYMFFILAGFCVVASGDSAASRPSRPARSRAVPELEPELKVPVPA
jgi:O-antigen ligase